MRNATFSLTPAQTTLAANVAMFAEFTADGGTLTIHHTKRDGTPTTTVGALIEVVGDASLSTHALRMDTDRGPRMVNTWSVTDMTGVYSGCGSTVEMPGLAALVTAAHDSI
jgi:hypothetical protein